MVAFDRADAKRIHHFVKVHNFATTIATLEGLDPQTDLITQAAAVVHDIGIHQCEQLYGKCDGYLQEKEGPALASQLLQQVGGFTPQQIERVAFLVGHHHTYSGVQGIDWQILLEADFLVNCYEDCLTPQQISHFVTHVFRTQSGLNLIANMFPQVH